ELRTTGPKVKADQVAITTTASVAFNHDSRLPMPGAILRRPYKGREIVVRVLPHGFEYEGEVYRTLSAVARAVTGTHWNGYHFFNLRPGRNGVAGEQDHRQHFHRLPGQSGRCEWCPVGSERRPPRCSLAGPSRSLLRGQQGVTEGSAGDNRWGVRWPGG